MSWTNKQVQKLLQLCRKGNLPSRIRISGKTRSQIHHKLEALRKCGALKTWFARPYTRAEDQAILAQLKTGKQLIEVAVPDRTAESMRHRLRVLRRRGRRINLIGTWSRKEDRFLITQLAAGKRPKDLVNPPGRTHEAVLKRLVKLRREKKLKLYFRTPGCHRAWTAEEIALLQDSRTAPGRTAIAIKAKLIELGLISINQKLSQAIKNAGRKTAEELELLRTFLEGEGRYWPGPLVADKFGCKMDYVCRFRKRLGLQLTHRDAIKDPVYREWHEQRMAKTIAKMYEGKYIRPKTVQELLKQMETDTLKPNGRSKLVQCRTCKRYWYFNERYFHAGLEICLACPVRRKAL